MQKHINEDLADSFRGFFYFYDDGDVNNNNNDYNNLGRNVAFLLFLNYDEMSLFTMINYQRVNILSLVSLPRRPSKLIQEAPGLVEIVAYACVFERNTLKDK